MLDAESMSFCYQVSPTQSILAQLISSSFSSRDFTENAMNSQK